MNDAAGWLLYVIFDPERMDTSRLQRAMDALGVMEQPLETISAGPLCVVASLVANRQAILSPPVDEVLTFRSVVEAVFGAGPVVPLRFGTVADSPARAASLIRENEPTYLDVLPRLEGRVEMGVSAELKDAESCDKAEADTREEPSVEEPSVEKPGVEKPGVEKPGVKSDAGRRADERPGTTYLRRKQQRLARERARIEAIASPFQRAIAEQISDVELSPPAASGGRVSLAFLIPSGEVERFRETVGQVQQTVERVQAPGTSSVEIVGPWAPYSFV